MRVSLNADPTEFVKQIAQLRRGLNRLEAQGDPGDAMKARLFSSTFVPFLNGMRAELRADGMSVADVLFAVSEMMGNLAATTMQSLFAELTDDERKDCADRMTAKAYDTIFKALMLDSDLAISITATPVPPQAEPPPPPSNVIALNPKGKH